MDYRDPSSAECLRILLERQSRQLQLLTSRIDTVYVAGHQALHPTHWSGIARHAHDVVAENFLNQLTAARHALDNAAAESSRAVTSLAGYVR